MKKDVFAFNLKRRGATKPFIFFGGYFLMALAILGAFTQCLSLERTVRRVRLVEERNDPIPVSLGVRIDIRYIDRLEIEKWFRSRRHLRLKEVSFRQPYISVFQMTIFPISNRSQRRATAFDPADITLRYRETRLHPYSYSAFKARFPTNQYASASYLSLLSNSSGGPSRLPEEKTILTMDSDLPQMLFLIYDRIPESVETFQIDFREAPLSNRVDGELLSMTLSFCQEIVRH